MQSTQKQLLMTDITVGTKDRMGAGVILVQLSKYYGDFTAVDTVNLQVNQGDFVALVGPSGAGKTTILHLIAGFKNPSDGDILVDGRSIIHRPPHRRNLGIVFQNYALFPHMTVFDNIAFPLKQRRKDRQEIGRRVNNALRLIGLPSLGDRFPKQLSGGQQQRVALARAIVFEPPLLLMDEPLSNLDRKLRDQMRSEIRRICNELGATVIYVTHDQEEALSLADKIGVINVGRVEQVGTPSDVYDNPANGFIADFIGEANFLSGKVRDIETGFAVVETINGLTSRIPVNCRPDLLLKGNIVTCMVRPEYVNIQAYPTRESTDRVSTDTSDGSSVFAIVGVVTETTYLGRSVKHKVDIGDSSVIDVHVARANTRGQTIKRGDKCKITWRIEDTRVLEALPSSAEVSYV